MELRGDALKGKIILALVALAVIALIYIILRLNNSVGTYDLDGTVTKIERTSDYTWIETDTKKGTVSFGVNTYDVVNISVGDTLEIMVQQGGKNYADKVTMVRKKTSKDGEVSKWCLVKY